MASDGAALTAPVSMRITLSGPAQSFGYGSLRAAGLFAERQSSRVPPLSHRVSHCAIVHFS